MNAAIPRQQTLHEAVRELADRGCVDPIAILATLSEQHGQAWLMRQLVSIVREIAGAGRSFQPPVRIVPGVPRVQRAAAGADVFAGSIWVDGEWKPLGDLTSTDCRTVASQYARLANAAERHRDWFLAAAEVVEREGAALLREVRQLLAPPLSRLELPAVSVS